jgi:hypothetical protein
MYKILIGKREFKEWNNKFLILQEKYPDNIFLYDFINENNLLKLIKKFDINLILPLSFEDMYLVSLSSKNIYCDYLCPTDYNDIVNLDDKCKFLKYFIDNGLEEYLPKTYVIKSKDISYIKPIMYPSIQKINIGFGGSGIYILNSKNDIKKINNYVIQEYIIDKNEYAGHFICKDGNIIFHKILKKNHNKEYFIQKGPMNEFEIIDMKINDFVVIFEKLNFVLVDLLINLFNSTSFKTLSITFPTNLPIVKPNNKITIEPASLKIKGSAQPYDFSTTSALFVAPSVTNSKLSFKIVIL